MQPFIVADIGGTNARFALITDYDSDTVHISTIQILQGKDYPSFSDALRAYISCLDCSPSGACVAIAGPISGDRVSLTNLAWSFSQRELKAEFGFDTLLLMNDFAATAMATSQVSSRDIVEIKAGDANPKGNKAIFGAGTGLGVAGLAYTGNSWLPIPSEGGHVNAPAATDYEGELVKAARQRLGFVSAETFLCGPGLVNLYRAVAAVEGLEAKPYSPPDITENALANSDDLCTQTLTHFCAMLGSHAGNLALTYGATGGVYIAGGVIPRFVDFFKASPFVDRFENKGVMSHFVKPLPIYLFTGDNPAFMGAARWYLQSLEIGGR